MLPGRSSDQAAPTTGHGSGSSLGLWAPHLSLPPFACWRCGSTAGEGALVVRAGRPRCARVGLSPGLQVSVLGASQNPAPRSSQLQVL